MVSRTLKTRVLSRSIRTALLVALWACMDNSFVLENPLSTMMFHYHRMKEAFRMLRAVGIKVGVAIAGLVCLSARMLDLMTCSGSILSLVYCCRSTS